MFLRRKTRSKLTRRDEVTHVASLVQSIRVAGAVRQQHIAYLGSLVATQGQFSPWAVRNFWQHAETIFDTLALPSVQRVRLQMALTHRLGPRPSEEALQRELSHSLATLPTSIPLSLLRGQEKEE